MDQQRNKQNSSLGLTPRKSWWEKTKFGSGNQHWPLNTEVFNPEFLDGRFTWNEIGFYLTLSFVAWKQRDFRILATEPFLIEGLAGRGIDSHGSIERCKKKWIDAGYLRRVRYGGIAGNEYLVSSLMLAKKDSQEMANYELASAMVRQAHARESENSARAAAEAKRLEEEKRRAEKRWLKQVKAAREAGRPIPEFTGYPQGSPN